MATAAMARAELVLSGLRSALADGATGLDVHYMPTVDIASGLGTGFEALVRLTDPKLGAISPSSFVPLAEGHDLAGDLGVWVRQRVLSDLQAGLLPAGRVAVNVSSVELADPSFADRFLDQLETAGEPAGRISVEVTETAVAAHFDQAVEALRRLQAADIPIALDDFGTGHASLDYLARLPCDTVKIDQSFVAGLQIDERCAAIVAGVVGMAHATGHRIIAEGVETTGQLDALAQLSCEEAQGFLFGRPCRPQSIPGPRTGGTLPGWPMLSAPLPAPRTVLAAQQLIDLVRDLGAAPTLDVAFGILVAALRPLVEFTGGSVQLLGPDGIGLAVAHPPATAEAMAARIPAGQGVGGAVIETGQLRYLPDITVPTEAGLGRSARARHHPAHPLLPRGAAVPRRSLPRTAAARLRRDGGLRAGGAAAAGRLRQPPRQRPRAGTAPDVTPGRLAATALLVLAAGCGSQQTLTASGPAAPSSLPSPSALAATGGSGTAGPAVLVTPAPPRASASAAPSPSPSRLARASATATAGTVVVTDSDNGRTVTLQPGQRLAVRLSQGTWDPPVSSDAKVVVRQRTRGGYPSSDPVGAEFAAVARGSADVSATSDAACFHTEPRCLMPSRVWSLQVIVG